MSDRGNAREGCSVAARGAVPATPLLGAPGGDTAVTLGSGDDTITAGGNGDTINAGAGTNTITAMGSDTTFVLPAAEQGFDTITGFSETNGDVLDLRAALAGTSWNHQASTLGTYLKVTDSGVNTTLAIAATGSGAGTAIATVEGVSYGLSNLLSRNSLLTSWGKVGWCAVRTAAARRGPAAPSATPVGRSARRHS